MIAERTLKRAALTSAITFGVLAVPTVSAWWAGAPHSEPVATQQRQPSIAAPPERTATRKASPRTMRARPHNVQAAARAKTPLARPDYSQFVVRLGRETANTCQ